MRWWGAAVSQKSRHKVFLIVGMISSVLIQGSPVFLNQRATSWLLGHTKLSTDTPKAQLRWYCWPKQDWLHPQTPQYSQKLTVQIDLKDVHSELTTASCMIPTTGFILNPGVSFSGSCFFLNVFIPLFHHPPKQILIQYTFPHPLGHMAYLFFTAPKIHCEMGCRSLG